MEPVLFQTPENSKERAIRRERGGAEEGLEGEAADESDRESDRSCEKETDTETNGLTQINR